METVDPNSPEGKLAAVRTELDTAKADVARLTSELATAKANEDAALQAKVKAESDLTDANAKLNAAKTKADADASTIASLTTERDALKAEKRDFDDGVAKEAARVAAAQSGAPLHVSADGGKTPMPGAKTDGPLTQEQKDALYAQMEKLPEAEQRAFYVKNIQGR